MFFKGGLFCTHHARPDKVFGLKAHSDRSGITLLLQDPGVEGLQVLNDGKWYMIPVIPEALFINLGDQMQVKSSGSVYVQLMVKRTHNKCL